MTDDKRNSALPINGLMWSLLAIGLAGLLFFFWKYDDVFPEASIDLKLSKSEIAHQSATLARQMGFNTGSAVESTTFGGDEYSKTFMEYEYPMDRANVLMKTEIPIWAWTTRFCQAFQFEEMKVGLSPDGKLRSFEYEIPNELPLPSLNHEQGQKLALDFATEKAGLALASFKLIKDSTIKQVKRTDHYFVWEDEGKNYKGSRLRTAVYVSGNKVTSFDYYLHVPDSFDRKYNQIRSYNDLYKSISGVLFAVVSAALVFVFFWAMSSGLLRWRFVLILALVAFVLHFLDTWNYLPGIISSFDTTKTFTAFLVDELLSSLTQALFAALGTVATIGGIEAIYRHMFRGKIAAEKYFSKEGLRSKQVFQALFIALALFGIHLGWVAFYYLYGRQLGVWSPLEIRDASTLSSIVPAFSSFNIGVNASVTEELMYRVLCLFLVQKLCRNFWLANLIQAAGWAFMHSDYPQEPAYARGLELTVVGAFYGWVLKEFGILPCILSHFTYDSFLGVTPLLFSGSWSSLLSGFIACCPALILFGLSVFYSLKEGFLKDESELLNANVGPVQKQDVLPVEGGVLPYQELLFRRKLLLLFATIILLVGAFLIPSHKFADDARLRIGRQEAIDKAREYLTARGIDWRSWQNSVWLTDNLQRDEIQYGFEKEGFSKAKPILSTGRYPLIWWVRFFKPLQHLEYYVLVNPEGKAIALDVVMDEDASGKMIDSQQAKELAMKFLVKDRPELTPFEFETISEQKRKNRLDHAVSFSVPKLKLGDAPLKVTISTVSDIVSFPRVAWEIPQAWMFDRQKQTIYQHTAKCVIGLYFVALMIAFIFWLVGLVRSQAIHWRPAIFLGLFVFLAEILVKANDLPGLFAGYSTDVPVETFLLRSINRIAVGALMYGASATLLAAIAYAAERLLQPGFTLPALLRICFRPGNPNEARTCRSLWKDGLILGYAVPLLLMAISVAMDSWGSNFSLNAQITSFEPLPKFSCLAFPFLDMFVQAVVMGLATVIVMPVLAGLHLRYLRTKTKTILFLSLSTLLLFASEKYLPDYLFAVSQTLMLNLTAYFLVIKFCKRNIIAYFVAGYVTSLIPQIVNSWWYARDVYAADCVTGIVALLLPILVGQARIKLALRLEKRETT
ncbi:MAG: CPBP family intramembrane metalloprotease [Candidatus Obscuribacterales bacterium]|nr:CPBP family intramembrane metalloprotease [Candidatus Obscuribacterales bacterium]